MGQHRFKSDIGKTMEKLLGRELRKAAAQPGAGEVHFSAQPCISYSTYVHLPRPVTEAMRKLIKASIAKREANEA